MKEYKIVLKFVNEEIFRGFFVDTKTYRIVKDEINLEKMIEELVEKGSIRLKEIDNISQNDYNAPVLDIEKKDINSLELLFEKIKELGYETIIEQNEDEFVEIVGIGKSIHPDIISQTDEYRLSKFSVELFKSINNKNYEPPLKKLEGSFKIKVLDEFDKESLIMFLENLKNGKTTDNVIHKIEELTKISDLEKIKIKVSNNKEFNFTKKELKNIISIIENNKTYIKKTLNIDISKIRSLDPKNLSFKIDLSKVILIKCETKELFETINNLYFTQNNNFITLKGYFKLERSFICEEIFITE